MNLYFLMTALFLIMALVSAIDASLTSFQILPWFNGLRWLRVHLITLGAMSEALFGLLPLLVALRHKLPRPAFRPWTWLSFNAGLLLLLVGIPIINQAVIFAGGSLIFAATVLLIWQLREMRTQASATETAVKAAGDGRLFYLAGLGYLLLGIIVGTGLWLGWSEWLQIKVPIEVHIHANNWGFLSLVFAGLLIDIYPTLTGRSLGSPTSRRAIFWGMTVGALGLILGPWFQSNYFAVPGLILHLGATFWLLGSVIRPLLGQPAIWRTPGIWHLLTSYIWILVPVMMAPLIILGVPGFPGAGIEQNAPQALIYGWVLQFGYALLPYFFSRIFLPGQPARLGGHWLSLAAVNLGGLALWASIFNDNYQLFLHGLAYGLWALSMLPLAFDLWRTIRGALARLEQMTAAPV